MTFPPIPTNLTAQTAPRTGPNPARRSAADRAGGLLAGMRIRKKLIFLHTTFSLVLAGVLMGVLRPAIDRVVEQAETHEVRLAIELAKAKLAAEPAATDIAARSRILSDLAATLGSGVTLRQVDPASPAASTLDPLAIAAARAQPGALVTFIDNTENAGLIINPTDGSAIIATARLEAARAGVVRLYIAALVALLTMYALIALALEVFVLPRHVYGPIRNLLNADAAARSGETAAEIIPASLIPADELGEIMRSRNQTVAALRQHEADLAHAMSQLELAASDLRKKNHLLEAAQRNLADADKLASLGVLSAGLAHELNTPLAVAKGLAEKLAHSPADGLNADESQLLVRVIGRLERLSESLLDFARVRPPSTSRVALRPLIDEAWTLVRLDREARRVTLDCDVDPAITIQCDADRMLQVLVNLLRNAADACAASPGEPRIEVRADATTLDHKSSVAIRISDTGPGISPEVMSRLFEPFATTKLDARGTGLGLAVSLGIIREHAGLLTARNHESRRGAVFEIVLPHNEIAAPATNQSSPAITL